MWQVVRGRCDLSEKEIKIELVDVIKEKKGAEGKEKGEKEKKSWSIPMSHDLLLKIYLIGAQYNLSKKMLLPFLDIAEM